MQIKSYKDNYKKNTWGEEQQDKCIEGMTFDLHMVHKIHYFTVPTVAAKMRNRQWNGKKDNLKDTVNLVNTNKSIIGNHV